MLTIPLLCAGCGGIAASPSFNPATLFIPGGFLLQVNPPEANRDHNV